MLIPKMADDILKGKTLKPFLIKTWYQILSLSFYGLWSSSWCKRNKQKKIIEIFTKNIREKGHTEHNYNIKSYLKIFSKFWEFRRHNSEV